ncbi:uncharacterized protein [Temnothorax longispinosus]|uniref:uncharacterized protein n=1 Tax=Temnothorax longispinosus TaxID=300112 RepID=UPI003A99099E
MEVDATCEIFQRSEEKYKIKYKHYVGDGDAKTFSAIQNIQPYGPDFQIFKGECVGHVQKRMGSRLRNVKKAEKGLGGRGKLTDILIKELTLHYGNAIRSNDTVESMKNAIWATFYHKCSADDAPQHDHCPAGPDSWCTWQKAKMTGTLAEYKHKPALHSDVQQAIKPVYEALTNDELLERCVGHFTQNANESFHSVVWKIAPKESFSGIEIVEIATYTAVAIFNDGNIHLLDIMSALGLQMGPRAFEMSKEQNSIRLAGADKKELSSTKQINTIYKTSTDSRRGLVDGIGSIAKSLFGTMDANDEKRINEQLQLLGNNQQTLHHAMQNQIKVMNATIGHIEKLEGIMERNRNLLEKRFTDYLNKDEIKEHFEIGIAVITDLIRDVENILEYLACIRKGTMHPKLMPVEDITWQLKAASQQLPPGSYFPFRVHLKDWFTIEKHTTIKAFYKNNQIYTVLLFPLITPPLYDIMSVIEFPVLTRKNILTSVRVDNKIIAVDKERVTYMLLDEDYLAKCTSTNLQYVCTQNTPVYRIDGNTPCEIQMYVQQQHYYKMCKFRHTVTTQTKWISLRRPHDWLYSTVTEQPILIQCNEHEEKQIINNTGKITLEKECKLMTTDMTVQAEETIYQTDIETYLPEVNISLTYDHETITLRNETTDDLTQHRAELTELKTQIQKMNTDLEDDDRNFYVRKQFIYPMTASGIITLAIVSTVIYVLIKKKKNPRSPLTLYDEERSFRPYGFPKPILKRSVSTRF